MDIDPQLLLSFLLQFGVVLFCLCFHEMAHAITAKWGGDRTAEDEGRITMNPLAHIDVVGTIIIPFLRFSTNLPLIGWARPVPVVETNLRIRNWGLLVAMAGPFSNLILMVVAAILLEGVLLTSALTGIPIGTNAEEVGLAGQVLFGFWWLCHMMVFVNAGLIIFNMLPVPPLDGSHILWHFAIRGRAWLYQPWFLLQTWSWVILMALFFFTPLGLWLAYGTRGLVYLVRTALPGI